MFKHAPKQQKAAPNTIARRLVQKSFVLGSNHPRTAQATLALRAPADRYEQEADHAAAQVMRSGEPHAAAVTPHAVGQTASGGQSLDAETRRFFESRFGHNFANVRVHADPVAHQSARNLQARAYTLGNNITFGAGEYQPTTRQGRQLLAHELAHVVQQTPRFGHAQGHTLAASLSKTPAPAVQRSLIATGDAAGFAALANAVIAVQQEVVVSPAGIVSLRATSIQGPPTPEAQELVSVLQTVIGNSNPTSIEFIHGVSSTRPSDARVMVGSYPQSKLDLDDIAAFGTQGSIGLGQGRTAGALLSHEITEQFRKQVHGEAFDVAHPQGEAAESLAVGGTRGTMRQRQVNATTLELTVPYTYPSGRIVEVTWDVVSGNVTNVRRTVLHP